MYSEIDLKSIKELLGMNFFIPSYQRGYRWEPAQATDLLDDVYAFATRDKGQGEIYCIQPLVVSEKEEDILAKCKSPEATLEDIKKYIKGSWNVVDGQQRLTTIYLILSCLEVETKYEIDYCTRKGSKEFLTDIEDKSQDDAVINIDYFHMYTVYEAIKDWMCKNDIQGDAKEKFKETLLNKVCFIWYQVKQEEEIAVFTRLNIGKIPLTDAELIKALFLNRAIYSSLGQVEKQKVDEIQRRIAGEWDQIEYALQDDEFWAFIYNGIYTKTTRIDFILDAICKQDKKWDAEKKNLSKFGDNHDTFRYYYEIITEGMKSGNVDWLDKIWGDVRMYYQVFDEWYHDYRLYHYIGYLTSIISKEFNGTNFVEKWTKQTKEEFIVGLKDNIAEILAKKEWMRNIENYNFEEEGKKSKRECVDLLLLHNVETIIQQNDKLVSDTRYNIPNFTKFPFHLYKKEKWQVEHIRPNAGDDLVSENNQKLYLSLAQNYLKHDESVCKKIDEYLNEEKKQEGNSEKVEFSDLLEEISQKGGALPEEDKNKIWNYVLLDESTNKEYGNQIFPVKRAFISNKEKGLKVKYEYKNGKVEVVETVEEVAFVLPCTKNVFSKFYTDMPTTMVNWNKEDADAYWDNMRKVLDYYFTRNRKETGGAI